jgi:hypothetical protein
MARWQTQRTGSVVCGAAGRTAVAAALAVGLANSGPRVDREWAGSGPGVDLVFALISRLRESCRCDSWTVGRAGPMAFRFAIWNLRSPQAASPSVDTRTCIGATLRRRRPNLTTWVAQRACHANSDFGTLTVSDTWVSGPRRWAHFCLCFSHRPALVTALSLSARKLIGQQ